MLSRVRESLLSEAVRSPQLLADVAGLEKYIAESYSSRSFIELLQNADDAGARRFAMVSAGGHIFVANDGRPFDVADFESLCRSASSRKNRGSSIGYRGVGFKAIVGLATKVYVVSEGLRAKFCRDASLAAIGVASEVPLIRIPHEIPSGEWQAFSKIIDSLTEDGFVTVFVLKCETPEMVASEFKSFDESSLLFLRTIEQVRLDGSDGETVTVLRDDYETSGTVEIVRGDSSVTWKLSSGRCSTIAHLVCAGEAISCDDRDAVFHAFLPTLDGVGLRLKINGDFSTDPSRTRLVLDADTLAIFRDAAETLIETIRECIASGDGRLLDALVGLVDPRSIDYQRPNASTTFLKILQVAGEPLKALRLSPPWLGIGAFELLAKRSGIPFVTKSAASLPQVAALLRFLGAQEARFDELSAALIEPLNVSGAADTLAYVISKRVTKQLAVAEFNENWPLWSSNRELIATNTLSPSRQVDASFIDMLAERGISRQTLANFLKPNGAEDSLPADDNVGSHFANRPTGDVGQEYSSVALDIVQQAIEAGRSSVKPAPASNVALRKWRTAEQYILDVLIGDGFDAIDVSRQNIGYDIEARKGSETLAIEVKLIEYIGMPFTLTSNEEAVARQLAANYIVAVVHQNVSSLDVMMIANPIASMQFVRQCRQWVWECSDYEFRSISYSIE